MKHCILFALLFITSLASGQVNGSIFISDEKGVPLGGKKYEDVEGTAFFTEEFNASKVTFKDNYVTENLQCKVNLYTHEVHYLNKDNQEWIFPKGAVREITFKKNYQSVKFKSGYPKTEKTTPSTLFQCEIDGNAQLLKLYEKNLVEVKEFNSASVTKKFTESESAYVFLESTLYKVKKDLPVIMEFFTRNPKVNQYILDNKLKTKNDRNLTEIIIYYNTL